MSKGRLTPAGGLRAANASPCPRKEDRESARSDVETDAELIERSLRGRPDAFVEVVGRHEVAVHGFLARRGGRQVADDLLSEVWVRAFGSRAAYDPGYPSARPWLYGIARNRGEQQRNGKSR
jgi:DNA-directed RNA polymerase specialized sigma24 family protein